MEIFCLPGKRIADLLDAEKKLMCGTARKSWSGTACSNGWGCLWECMGCKWQWV